MDDELRSLEETLWRAETRFERSHLETVLAPDFAEFGRSGRAWSRAEIMDMPASAIDVDLPLGDFRRSMLAPDVALVTYVSVHRGQRTNRSSVWVRGTDGWRLRFHQGTPAPG